MQSHCYCRHIQRCPLALAQCRGDNEVGLAPVNLKYLIKTFAEPNQVILMCTFNNTANEIECKVQRVPPGS